MRNLTTSDLPLQQSRMLITHHASNIGLESGKVTFMPLTRSQDSKGIMGKD